MRYPQPNPSKCTSFSILVGTVQRLDERRFSSQFIGAEFKIKSISEVDLGRKMGACGLI